jgi:hypothetical protein
MTFLSFGALLYIEVLHMLHTADAMPIWVNYTTGLPLIVTVSVLMIGFRTGTRTGTHHDPS